jgi:hypothetical protein
MASDETPSATRNGAKPQNTRKTRTKRESNGRFAKGVCGNPGGRPKGVSTAAREDIGDDPRRLTEDESAKPADRIAAAREYLDRGWGKAPAYAPVEGADPLGLSDVDQSIAGLVDELAARREAASPGEAADGALAASGEDGA